MDFWEKDFAAQGHLKNQQSTIINRQRFLRGDSTASALEVGLRSLYEHLQARILKMIGTLDELRASAEMEIFREVEQDKEVIDRIAAAQREELAREIAGLEEEAERVAEEARGLAGEVPF